MKNYIYSSILLFFLNVNIFGQSPDSWFVNENNFEYTMSFVTFVNIDGADLANTNDKVAAFVNGECRGVTNLIYVTTKDRYYAYLTVFSNANEEVINFKIYDSANNTVKNVIKKEDWSIGNEFKLAKLVLEENYDEAGKLMIKIGKNDELVNQKAYNKWPLFKLFRKTDQFKASYLELYNEEFTLEELQSKKDKEIEIEEDK